MLINVGALQEHLQYYFILDTLIFLSKQFFYVVPRFNTAKSIRLIRSTYFKLNNRLEADLYKKYKDQAFLTS